jgi:hypothetical protein
MRTIRGMLEGTAVRHRSHMPMFILPPPCTTWIRGLTRMTQIAGVTLTTQTAGPMRMTQIDVQTIVMHNRCPGAIHTVAMLHMTLGAYFSLYLRSPDPGRNMHVPHD